MDLPDSSTNWHFNCDAPQFVDFAALNTEDDGADEWFDIHQEDTFTNNYKIHFNKENQPARFYSPKKFTYTAKRVSLDKMNPRLARLSGDKKALRRSVPARVLVNNASTQPTTTLSSITEKMNQMPVKSQQTPSAIPRRQPRNLNRVSSIKKVEKADSSAEIQKESNKIFAASLRNSDVKPLKTSNEQRLLMTKSVPFRLTESKREKVKPSVFRSMAEQVADFQKKTPARFRSSRRRSSSIKAPTGKVVPLKATIPITPNLQTRSRSRPTTAISREEQESLELEKIKKQAFKHRPLDPKLFTKPVIKKVEVKITKPEPFNLTAPKTKLRRSLSLNTLKPEFKAKPIPTGLFEGPKGLGSFKELPLTNPKSPAFFKHRTERRRSSSADGNFARNPPKFITPKTASNGIMNIKWEKKPTLVAPFSFDDKDKARFSRKDEKIKEIVEKEKKLAEFHAHPMPDLSVVKIPEKHVKPCTEILPFKFIRDNSGISRTEKWKQEMEEELEKQREMTKFKARPNRVIFQPPFIPEKSNKKLTNVSDFDLHTELRSADREEFEGALKLKEARTEALRKELELRQQEEEQNALLELRKNAVPKANPVRHYKPVNVKPSDIPLTTPMTPNFKKK